MNVTVTVWIAPTSSVSTPIPVKLGSSHGGGQYNPPFQSATGPSGSGAANG